MNTIAAPDHAFGPAMVVGLGNEWRGDDAVGLVAARQLRARLGPRVHVLECSGDPAPLLPEWKGRGLVVLVDAMEGETPGRVQRFEPLRAGSVLTPPPALHSTHALGVAQLLALGEALELLPRRLVIYALCGDGWTMGRGLSPAVAAALPVLCACVIGELAGGRDGRAGAAGPALT